MEKPSLLIDMFPRRIRTSRMNLNHWTKITSYWKFFLFKERLQDTVNLLVKYMIGLSNLV
jgi:hypothetical protein